MAEPGTRYRVGVDIGGTFTDFCAFDERTSQVHALKVLSTPETPGREVIEGLRRLEERFSVSPAEIGYFTHGTTVGVNTVIQKKGIRLCLFATEHFVDVLEIAPAEDAGPLQSQVASARPPGAEGPGDSGARAHAQRRPRRNFRSTSAAWWKRSRAPARSGRRAS